MKVKLETSKESWLLAKNAFLLRLWDGDERNGKRCMVGCVGANHALGCQDAFCTPILAVRRNSRYSYKLLVLYGLVTYALHKAQIKVSGNTFADVNKKTILAYRSVDKVAQRVGLQAGTSQPT